MPHQLPSNLNVGCNGTLFCISEYMNNVTNGMFFPLILMTFLVVLFISTQRFGTPRAFGFASFIGIFSSIILVTVGLMPYWIASLYIITGVVGLAVLVLNEK